MVGESGESAGFRFGRPIATKRANCRAVTTRTTGTSGYNKEIAPRSDSPARRPRVSDAAADPVNLPPAEKVKTFPTTPGCYLMRNADGKVIYVCKAKNLRNRAGTYFTTQA